MKQTKTSSILLLIASVLFIFLFVFFTYTFLHEAGHAIIGLAFGQSLTEFNVNFWDFSAHVGMRGEELTQSQLAIRSVAGASLPLLIWVAFISLVPRNASFILEALKLISSMAVINTLLAWIILPVLFLLGKTPPDDVTNFLRYSQMPPLLLMLTAIILYAGAWILFLSKINGLRNEFLLFRTINSEILTTETRKPVSIMMTTLALCLLFTFMLNYSASNNPLDRFSPPQDFVSVGHIDLSARAYSAETLTQFSLDEPEYVGIFIAVHNVDTTYFELSVIGPDGYSSTVLHGEGYNTNRDGGLWEEKLQPGTYQVVLTSDQSPGTASVYLKTPNSK
jgi:hypothetical protein